MRVYKLRVLTPLLIILLISSQTASAQTYDLGKPSNLHTTFLPFFGNAVLNDGSITRDLNNDGSIRTGIANGLGMITLMKLYDLYEHPLFLQYAKEMSNFISTALVDLRYPLFATYFDYSTEVISNYRAIEDNFLIAWGLDLLADRIDPENELEVKRQTDRKNFVEDSLDLFDATEGFQTQVRVDTPTSSQIFKVFPNLFASYIITESQSDTFDDFVGKPEAILEYVQANATLEDGGVNTIVFRGISDDLVTLKNTVLYGNLALNLYAETGDEQYLTIANDTANYIQDNFYDIGVSGGYLESIQDGVPIQQSKSLFSHALILQLFLKLANLGDNTARLNFLSVWNTINNYFRQGSYFYSTLDWSGEPSSLVIDSVDNLMMMYSMSSLPLITHVNYTSFVDFEDSISIKMNVSIPENINSQLVIRDQDDVIVHEEELSGTGDTQALEIEIDPERPNNDEEEFPYEIELRSEGVVIDDLSIDVTVSLAPGVDLSVGVITIFSLFAVVIFAMFVKRASGELQQSR